MVSFKESKNEKAIGIHKHNKKEATPTE